MSKEEFLKQI